MARLPLIDPETTSGDMRASFDRMPIKLNVFRMLAHAESNFVPAMRFANSILHKQKLGHVHRELLILAFSLGAGVGVQAVPEILNPLPEAARLVFSSGITTGGIAAFILNAVLPTHAPITQG